MNKRIILSLTLYSLLVGLNAFGTKQEQGQQNQETQLGQQEQVQQQQTAQGQIAQGQVELLRKDLSEDEQQQPFGKLILENITKGNKGEEFLRYNVFPFLNKKDRSEMRLSCKYINKIVEDQYLLEQVRLPRIELSEEEQQKPFGRLFYENSSMTNKGDELFRHGVLSFLDAKDRSEMRLSCKYINNIVEDQWKATLKNADEDRINNTLANAAKHGYLKLVEFLVTHETTKVLITIPYYKAVNQAIEKAARNGHTNIVKLLTTHETTRNLIISGDASYGVIGALNGATDNNHKDIVIFLTTNETTKGKITSEGVDETIRWAEIYKRNDIIEILEKFKKENFKN